MRRTIHMLVAITLIMSVPRCTEADRPVGSGSLLFTSSNGNHPAIYSVSADGLQMQPIEAGLTGYTEPAWSPDGNHVAFAGFTEGGGDRLDIYVVDADGAHLRQLTSESGDDRDPAWSPDGTKIVFSRLLKDGHRRLFVADVSSRRVTQLTDDETYQDEDPDWSPDGEEIAFMRNADTFPSIYVIDADGKNLRRLTNGHADTAPAWSPDGRRIAFVRDQDQAGEHRDLYAMDADGSHATQLWGGSVWSPEPTWSPDGANIAFVHAGAINAIRPDGSDETTILDIGDPEVISYLGQGGVDWVS